MIFHTGGIVDIPFPRSIRDALLEEHLAEEHHWFPNSSWITFYKQRANGHREEYLYVYDRTGGRTSGPGIKSFVNHKIQDLQVLDETFEPRHPINLAKAGEFTGQNYFGKPFGSGRSAGIRSRATLRHGWRYTVQCVYCSRTFKRMRRDTTMKPHKDGYGNNCFGRRGMIVNQELV